MQHKSKLPFLGLWMSDRSSIIYGKGRLSSLCTFARKQLNGLWVCCLIPTASRWWTHRPSTNTTVSAAFIWMPDPPASFCFLFQNHLSYFSSFPFIHIFKLTCLHLHKNLAATLMGIVLDLCTNLGRLDITRCAGHFQS